MKASEAREITEAALSIDPALERIREAALAGNGEVLLVDLTKKDSAELRELGYDVDKLPMGFMDTVQKYKISW